MKRFLTSAAALLSAMLVLVSCGGFQTQTYEDDLVVPLADGAADSLFFSISLEYVTGGVDEAVLEQMNYQIVSHAFDLEGQAAPLEETAVRYRENLIDEYLTENGNPSVDGVLSWEDRVNGNFTAGYKQYLNYLLTYYSFRGGAHGIQTVTQMVLDKKTGAPLSEDDLFVPAYQAPVSALIREAIRSSLEADDAELLPLVEMEQVAPNGNFSLSADGIQWLYQPYEVAPYALGIVSATVSWEQLKPYLK